MTIRNLSERLRQTLWFEAAGILIVTPLYIMTFGRGVADGAGMIVLLSGAVMLWSPVHNTLFDRIEFRRTGRLASDRPHRMRVVHALSHEVSTVAVTLPLLVWVGGHSWTEALILDVLLSAFYAAYAYLFHIVYDRLRPVRPTHATALEARA